MPRAEDLDLAFHFISDVNLQIQKLDNQNLPTITLFGLCQALSWFSLYEIGMF